MEVGLALLWWAVAHNLQWLCLHFEWATCRLRRHKLAREANLTSAHRIGISDASWVQLRMRDRCRRRLHGCCLQLDVLLLLNYSVLSKPVSVAPTWLCRHLILLTWSHCFSSLRVITRPDWHWSLVHRFLNVFDVRDMILDFFICLIRCSEAFILAWIVQL